LVTRGWKVYARRRRHHHRRRLAGWLTNLVSDSRKVRRKNKLGAEVGINYSILPLFWTPFSGGIFSKNLDVHDKNIAVHSRYYYFGQARLLFMEMDTFSHVYRCTGPLRLRDDKISINAPTSTGGVFLLMQSKQFIIHWRVEKQEENKDLASVIALDV